MHLVDPDILADAQGLSPAVCVVGMVLGVALWLFGGRGHRFWLVLLITLAAGVYGLSVAEAYAVQPLVAGVLLGVAAGGAGPARLPPLVPLLRGARGGPVGAGGVRGGGGARFCFCLRCVF